MKILFADAGGLSRYSMILVAKECAPNMEVFEADNITKVNLLLKPESISTLFINANLFNEDGISQIQNIRDLRNDIQVILMTDAVSTYKANAHLMPHVDGVLDLLDTLENSKANIAKFLSRDSGNS